MRGWLGREYRKFAAVVLFFFIGFMLIFVLLKLFILQYSIEFYAFSKAAIGALILGKVVLVMDKLKFGRGFDSYPRAVAVVYKTFVYGLAVIAVGIADRLIHACRQAGNLREALHVVIARTNLNHFLAVVLLISLIICAYFVMLEINRAMGEGALFRLFFRRPSDNPKASLPMDKQHSLKAARTGSAIDRQP
jgi:hypothetical protein